MTSGTLLSYN